MTQATILTTRRPVEAAAPDGVGSRSIAAPRRAADNGDSLAGSRSSSLILRAGMHLWRHPGPEASGRA